VVAPAARERSHGSYRGGRRRRDECDGQLAGGEWFDDQPAVAETGVADEARGVCEARAGDRPDESGLGIERHDGACLQDDVGDRAPQARGVNACGEFVEHA
jgi:hypothetical protein